MKALIGMSGGVDSSVAAFLMKEAGYECLGATMRLLETADGAEDAAAVARRMGMPFYVFDLAEEFRAGVMEPFVRCYQCGLTPNPCIECNKRLKFGKFLERLWNWAVTASSPATTPGSPKRTGGTASRRPWTRARTRPIFSTP